MNTEFVVDYFQLPINTHTAEGQFGTYTAVPIFMVMKDHIIVWLTDVSFYLYTIFDNNGGLWHKGTN